MLFKLLKYDFRAMWKQFSLVWGAALALALVNRFVLFQDTDNAILSKDGLFMFAFVAVIVAMFVIAIGFVINRFSKGLLGDEGYLMHTLPVRSWELVASKLICGTITWMGCGVVALLSPVLMLPLNLPDLLRLPWLDALRGVMKHPDVVALIAEFCLMLLSTIVQTIAVIYLSLSIGHLFPRHRRLAGVAVFIGLYILTINLYARIFSWRPIEAFVDAASGSAYGSMLVCIAAELVPAALFLAAVCWILEHKLNLE